MAIRPKSIVPIIGEPDIDESYIRQQDAVQAEKLQLITDCDIKTQDILERQGGEMTDYPYGAPCSYFLIYVYEKW